MANRDRVFMLRHEDGNYYPPRREIQDALSFRRYLERVIG